MKFLAASILAVVVAGVSLGALLRQNRAASEPAASAPASPPRLDLRRTLGRPAPFLRRFDYAAMYPAAAPDQIPSIDRPRFETPEEARDLLPPTSLVIGLARNGEARAYPTNLLSLHEVVNDVVGGEPIAVTWCPLCQTALGFDRRVDGRVLTFGVSGYLYQANLMLFDRETGSLWSQLLGGAVTGRYRGTALRRVPLVHETWEAWLAEHPETRVLSIEQDEFAERFTSPDTELTSRGEELSNSPYGAYATKVGLYFRRVVRELSEGTRVLGLALGGRSKAYPVHLLRRDRAVEDRLAGEPVLVTFDESAFSGSVFSRRVRGRVLSFRLAGKELVDRETGSRWSLTTGRAVAGPLAGTQLVRLSATFSYWFAWRRFHPATAIYRG